jgi:hypothetical protein
MSIGEVNNVLKIIIYQQNLQLNCKATWTHRLNQVRCRGGISILIWWPVTVAVRLPVMKLLWKQKSNKGSNIWLKTILKRINILPNFFWPLKKKFIYWFKFQTYDIQARRSWIWKMCTVYLCFKVFHVHLKSQKLGNRPFDLNTSTRMTFIHVLSTAHFHLLKLHMCRRVTACI